MSASTTIPEVSMLGIKTMRRTKLLCNSMDPEEKRRIIGDTFMVVANDVRKRKHFQTFITNRFSKHFHWNFATLEFEVTSISRL
jgi:hypothetical protein